MPRLVRRAWAIAAGLVLLGVVAHYSNEASFLVRAMMAVWAVLAAWGIQRFWRSTGSVDSE